MPADTDVQLSIKEFSSEAVTIEQLSEENISLHKQLSVLNDEIDGGRVNERRGLHKVGSVGSIAGTVSVHFTKRHYDSSFID